MNDAAVPDRLIGISRPGGVTVGTFIGLGSPATFEIVCAAQPDWVVVDLEHGACDEAFVSSVVPVARAYGVKVLVRVESPERIRIGRVLDLGVDGIMVPRLESAAQAGEVVSATRFPPAGVRGAARYNRAAGWGGPLRAEGPVVAIQIETPAALEQAADIAAVDGVDVLFVGPLDLSLSLGCEAAVANPVFREALERVASAARSTGIVAGTLAPSTGVAQQYVELGYGFIGISSDSVELRRVFSESFESGRVLRGAS